MRTGLTFEEFVDLRLRPQAGAGPVFQQAAEMERDEMFPMATAEAANHLRSRGYDCKPAMLEGLVSDPVLLCDILFSLVQPEAQAKNISDEDFGRALGGDVLDQATTALLEELVDFFPSGRRQVFRKALDKRKTLEGKALETATRRLESMELEQKMAAALAALPGGSTPGDSSGSSPASSA